MNKIQQKLVSTKNAIVANQNKILKITVVTLAGAVTIQRIGLKQHDEFLKENGLYEEFYADSETEEVCK